MWVMTRDEKPGLLESARGGRGADFRFRSQPGIKVGLAEDFEDASHSGVPYPTKLGALNVICPRSRGNEMKGYAHPRIGILSDPQRDHFKGMNHIHGGQMHDDGLVD